MECWCLNGELACGATALALGLSFLIEAVFAFTFLKARFQLKPSMAENPSEAREADGGSHPSHGRQHQRGDLGEVLKVSVLSLF